MRGFESYPEDSGMIVGEAYQLEYSKRQGQWTLRHPIDRRRAWRDSSLLGLVESVLRDTLIYRYDLTGHNTGTFQPHSRSFEGILLAVAGHPQEFVIPPEFEGDYSRQELDFVRRWQEILVAGTASDEEVPIDAQSLSFQDALDLISAAGRADDDAPEGDNDSVR